MVAFPACSDQRPGLAAGCSAAAQTPALPLLNPCGFVALTHVLATCVFEPSASFRMVPVCSTGFAQGLGGLAPAPVHSHSKNNRGVSSRALPVSLPVGFYPPSHPTVQIKPASHTHLQHLTGAGDSSLRALKAECPCAGRGEGNGAAPVCAQAPEASVSAPLKAVLAGTLSCASPWSWPHVHSWAGGQAVHLTHPIASHPPHSIPLTPWHLTPWDGGWVLSGTHGALQHPRAGWDNVLGLIPSPSPSC